MRNEWGDELATQPATNPWGDPIAPAQAATPEADPGSTPPGSPSQPSLLQGAARFAGQAVDAFDSFTGAPIRKAVGAALDVATSDLDRSTLSQVPEAALAAVRGFRSQWGGDPGQAPTSKALAERAGFSPRGAAIAPQRLPSMTAAIPGQPTEFRRDAREGFSPAGMAGLAGDILTPMPIPGGGMVKASAGTGGRMAMAAGKGGVKATAKAADFAAKAADVATGTQAGTKTLGAAKSVFGAAEKGFEDLGKAVKARYGSKLAPEADKFIQVAAKNGIDPNLLPESVMFGQASSASRLARAKAETPMGQALRERHEEAGKAIQNAIRGDIRRIAGETKDQAGNVVREATIPATAYEAGDLIKSAYDSKVDEILGGMDVTYKSLAQNAPGAKIPLPAMQRVGSYLADLEKRATDMGIDAFDKTTEAQAQHLLEVVSKVRNAGDNLAAVTRGLQGLGRTTFKTKTPLGQIPPDTRELRKLYGELSEAVVDGAKANFGPDVASQLRQNNKAISEMFGDKALIPSLGDVGKSEDKLFRSLILEGDTKRINTLKKYLTPEQLQAVKGAALQTLIKESPQGEFTFRTLHNRLHNKEDAFNALFSPGELANLQDLVQLGDKLGPAVLSTSGTGGSMAAQSMAWRDRLHPGRLVDAAETGLDKAAAAKQKAKASRAIGFNTEEPRRAAAQSDLPPTIMGLRSNNRATLDALMDTGYGPRKKAAQVAGAQREEEKPKKSTLQSLRGR